MPLVFVYGTLKQGQPNHHRLLDAANGEAEFVSWAVTVQRFPLVIATEHNIPFLLNVPGDGARIHGEIYRVDAAMLDFLDRFEGVPAMYQRHPVELEVKEWAGGGEEAAALPRGAVTEAFVYSTNTYGPDWPALRRYESYDCNGDHGLKYRYREER